MSVILEALKKLDRERSLRRQASANIAVDILRPDLPRPENKLLRYGAIILFTAIGTGAITYFTSITLMKKSPTSSPMISTAPSQKVIPPPEESDFPLKSSAPQKGDSTIMGRSMAPASVYREPFQETRKEMSQAPTKTEVPSQRKVSEGDKVLNESKPPPTFEEKKERPTVFPEKQEVIPKSVPEKDPQTQVTGSPITPSSLKISAIVWYEAPSMRFAIINGLKATEGSFIEGVKVVEIKPTSVRLFYNETLFELSIDR